MVNSVSDAPTAVVRRLLHYARPRQLQLVVRMAELGAIQKAAEALGMSQPSATQALTRLEGLLGVTLFDRHARGVRLTREGTLLMPALNRALASFDMLARDAAHVGQGASGLVRIAGIAAASTAVVAPALPTLCASHPELWIDYREIDASQIPSLCSEDGADIVLCRASVAVPDGYSFVGLKQDSLGVYCASDDPLAARRTLSPRACANATWLMPPMESPPHRAFVELCKQMNLSPNVARFGTRTLGVSVALVCRLRLLYVGLESHVSPFVDAGQLRRLPLAVPGSVDWIGMLVRERMRAESDEVVARHLATWAAR
jgi:DNA-binding transcriptional LysR family regulator